MTDFDWVVFPILSLNTWKCSPLNSEGKNNLKSNLVFLWWWFYFYYYRACICVMGHIYYGTFLVIRGKPYGVYSFLHPLCGFQMRQSLVKRRKQGETAHGESNKLPTYAPMRLHIKAKWNTRVK